MIEYIINLEQACDYDPNDALMASWPERYIGPTSQHDYGPILRQMTYNEYAVGDEVHIRNYARKSTVKYFAIVETPSTQVIDSVEKGTIIVVVADDTWCKVDNLIKCI